MIFSSLTSRSAVCEVVVLGGEVLPSPLILLSCYSHFVGFQGVVPWRHWGTVLASSQFDFFRRGSVLDRYTFGEVSFIVEVRGSTSFLCLNWGMRVLYWVSVVRFLWKLTKWVSWGCCQTTCSVWLKCWNISLRSVNATSGMKTFHF